MSWSFYAKGTKEEIAARVSKERESVNSGFPQVEQDQKAMALNLVGLTLGAVEIEGKGFNVEAFGSCTTSGDKLLANNVSVKIESVDLETK